MKTVEQFSGFLREVRLELSRVAWPTVSELVGSLVVVLLLVLAISIFLGGVDFVFYHLTQQIFLGK